MAWTTHLGNNIQPKIQSPTKLVKKKKKRKKKGGREGNKNNGQAVRYYPLTPLLPINSMIRAKGEAIKFTPSSSSTPLLIPLLWRMPRDHIHHENRTANYQSPGTSTHPPHQAIAISTDPSSPRFIPSRSRGILRPPPQLWQYMSPACAATWLSPHPRLPRGKDPATAAAAAAAFTQDNGSCKPRDQQSSPYANLGRNVLQGKG